MNINDYMSPDDWANHNPRKVGVLQLRADGYENQQIAEMCYTTYNTVKSINRNTLIALEAKNSLNAVAIAMRLGIIE